MFVKTGGREEIYFKRDQEYAQCVKNMDHTECVRTYRKLENILRKLVEPNFELKNDLYLNLLLTPSIIKNEHFLSHDNTKTESNYDEINDLFLQWIMTASNVWFESKNEPSTSVLLFAFNVACHLGANEKYFLVMNEDNVYDKLSEASKSRQKSDTAVVVGFITLLTSVLKHPTGMRWLLTTTYWNDVINIGLKDPTKYVKKKAYQFIIQLLDTSFNLEKNFCEELVDILMEPLNEAAAYVETLKDFEKENGKVYQSLKPSLDLVSEVTDTLLKNVNKNVLSLFMEMEIPVVIQTILNFSQIEDFSFDLLKIRLVFLFYYKCEQLEVNYEENILFFVKTVFDLIGEEIIKDHVKCVIKICHYGLVLSSHLDNRLPLCIRKGETIEFQNQMILVQLVPVLCLDRQMHGSSNDQNILRTDDERRSYVIKVIRMSAIKTIDLSLKWFDYLLQKSNLIDYVAFCLQYIIKSKNLINKEQAALIFQPLVYCLRDMEFRLEGFHGKEMPTTGIRYFTVVVDTIIDLVECFDLTWTDSLATNSVLELACDIVKYDYKDHQLSVKFLQLLNLAISRCMAPNMVLLMNNPNDRVLSDIGDILFSKCHDGHHEVRFNALVVIRTLAVNAQTRFVEFAKVLLNAKLPQLVVEKALRDCEPLVKAEALRCTQDLIMVDDIWEMYEQQNDFWEHIIGVFADESYGGVRKEAAMLMYRINEYRQFPEDLSERVYSLMTYAAIGDIHWEVKCNAIEFWTSTIEKYLQAQGMIDNKFPTYTFSKQKRKIVLLTETEIKKRIILALDQLSDIGCLYVLKRALQDPFDEEVSKKAYVISKRILLLLDAYKVSLEDIYKQLPNAQKARSDSCTDSSNNELSPQRRFSMDSMYSQAPSSPFFPDPLSPSSYSEEMVESPSSCSIPATAGKPYRDHKSPSSSKNYSSDLAESEDELNQDILQDLNNPFFVDLSETEHMFDQLLKLSDATLLENIFSLGYQQTKNTQHITSRKYIPPSEFVKYCQEVLETYEQKSVKQPLQSLDNFDTLVSDIYKEFGLDSKTAELER